jgi:hypothetical protein
MSCSPDSKSLSARTRRSRPRSGICNALRPRPPSGSELQDKIDQLETKVATFGAQRGSSPQGDEGRAARDPGDAVPPGVGVAEPDEPNEEDRRVFEHLNEKLGSE